MANGSPRSIKKAKSKGLVGGIADFQAVFAGADIVALKVELNAFRTKLIAAGLMKAS